MGSEQSKSAASKNKEKPKTKTQNNNKNINEKPKTTNNNIVNFINPNQNINIELSQFQGDKKIEIYNIPNCIKYECIKKNGEKIFIYKVNLNKLETKEKNTLINNIKFMSSLKEVKDSLKIIES